MKAHYLLAGALLAAAVCAPAWAAPGKATDPILTNHGRKSPCGELHNAFGPWDYREGNIDNRVNIVLSVHFPAEVENNERGARGSLGADMDYTLRALPNYIPALLAMARQAKKERTLQPAGAHYPVECYFERAMRFQPKDAAVRTAYANWLREQGRDNDARAMYLAAVELTPGNAAANYNVGLLYYRAKDYEKANLYAHRAYALGFPLPALKNLLVKEGKWADVTDEQLDLPDNAKKAAAEAAEATSDAAAPGTSAKGDTPAASGPAPALAAPAAATPAATSSAPAAAAPVTAGATAATPAAAPAAPPAARP